MKVPGERCGHSRCWNWEDFAGLEWAHSFSWQCRAWQRRLPLPCRSLRFDMKPRRSVSVLAIPLSGSISARAFIIPSDRSGMGRALRAASFVKRKPGPAASGGPCLGSDDIIWAPLSFLSSSRRNAAERAGFSQVWPGAAPLIQIKHPALPPHFDPPVGDAFSSGQKGR
jgi:hypothetical protein